MKKVSLGFTRLICAVLFCAMVVGFMPMEVQAEQTVRIRILVYGPPDAAGWMVALENIHFGLYSHGERVDEGRTSPIGIIDFDWTGSLAHLYIHVLDSGEFTLEKTRIPVYGTPIVRNNIDFIFDFERGSSTTPGVTPPAPTNTLVVIGGANPQIELRGQIIPNASPVIVETAAGGVTLVPLRVISENMGAQVQWNGELRQVTVAYNNRNVVLTIDRVEVEGHDNLPHAPILINDSTHVPLRFLGETVLGLAVDFQPGA